MNENAESFVFYPSFADSYFSLEETHPEMAKKFIEAVMLYGGTGEYDEGEDGIVDALMGPVKVSIDGAKNRYNRAVRRGVTGGAPAKYDEEEILEFIDEGHTQKEAADKFGCAISTVKRYVKARKERFEGVDDWDGMF